MSRIGFLIAGLVLAAGLASAPAQEKKDEKKEEKKRQEFKGWGTLTEHHGCTVKEKGGKLVIEAPPADEKRTFRGGWVTRPVSGDFVAQVKVTADWDLGPAVKGKPSRQIVAGLLVIGSMKAYVRWDRNLVRFRDDGPLQYLRTPHVVKDGKQQQPTLVDANYFEGRSTWLRVTRTGRAIQFAHSPDGKSWSEHPLPVIIDLPAEVQVGVDAFCGTTKGFTAEFEDLKITSKGP